MESIILIGDKDFNIKNIEKLEHKNSIRKGYSDYRYVVEYSDCRIYYSFEPQLIADYDYNELNIIPFKEPSFILVDYTSLDILKELITTEYAMYNIWIDNDHNIILSIEDFINTLKENHDYDWRNSCIQ